MHYFRTHCACHRMLSYQPELPSIVRLLHAHRQQHTLRRPARYILGPPAPAGAIHPASSGVVDAHTNTTCTLKTARRPQSLSASPLSLSYQATGYKMKRHGGSCRPPAAGRMLLLLVLMACSLCWPPLGGGGGVNRQYACRQVADCGDLACGLVCASK